MGFLQHRHQEAKDSSSLHGDSHLFFGCRRQSEDWLFKEQMLEYVANGTLTQLFTAFSRDQDEKHYVQHDLRANGQLVSDLLLGSDGYLFVCGDGMAMAKDVHAALVEILTECGGLSLEDAELKLRELSMQHRYVRDIW
ncbi:NADPH-cytochrome p450 reductase [Phytophthora palmivora]|uniref:NADPH-cytochrome p450 reductase n=1 Tax=Phytophthora palmivora TaxID=4796 RepID=A0A2P4Y9U2_9STRA|nr:NADPH-cytochrome p450 reductase [Phytophthora palmivora]